MRFHKLVSPENPSYSNPAHHLRPLISLARQLTLFQSIVSSLNVTEFQPLAAPSRSLLEARSIISRNPPRYFTSFPTPRNTISPSGGNEPRFNLVTVLATLFVIYQDFHCHQLSSAIFLMSEYLVQVEDSEWMGLVSTAH